MSAIPAAVPDTNLIVMNAPAPAGAPSQAALVLVDAVDQPDELALYGAEEHLEALVNCLDLVAPEQEGELVDAIHGVLGECIEKRDSVGRWFSHLDNQIAFGKTEIARLKTRVSLFETLNDKTEDLMVKVLRKLGRDPKDKTGKRWRKLEGRTYTLGLKNLPASVEFDDETQIPATYRRITVTLPETLWEEMLDSLPVHLGGRLMDESKRSAEALKTGIKDAIERNIIVPGAHMEKDRVKLVRA